MLKQFLIPINLTSFPGSKTITLLLPFKNVCYHTCAKHVWQSTELNMSQAMHAIGR